ncbi:MAG: DUF58 domain-containing protein [Planctomycetes bacterium]|nr:DUF58 domain-containing protein [Planctomycetota bacterium]
MLPRDIVRQIRRLHIRARRAVEDLLGGEYHSVFKGAGIAFEEVREYQPGDDVRAIDWNVTARMGHPFIKRFVEERELTVMLLVDASGSQKFGSRRQSKRDVAGELAAILAFSAIANNDKVGLLVFTDQVEKYVPPRKGVRHVLRLIRDVLFFEPHRPGTCIRAPLDYLNRVLRRRTIVFLLSDFLDTDFDKALKRTGRRHDLVLVNIADPREESLPDVGLLSIADAETEDEALLDTSSQEVRDAFAAAARQRRDALKQSARAARLDTIDVSTAGGHLDALVRFFKLRERRLRRI